LPIVIYREFLGGDFDTRNQHIFTSFILIWHLKLKK